MPANGAKRDRHAIRQIFRRVVLQAGAPLTQESESGKTISSVLYDSCVNQSFPRFGVVERAVMFV